MTGTPSSTVIPQIQALIGNVLDRCITDAGYRGHNAPPDYKFKIYATGQKRRVTPPRSSASSNDAPRSSRSSAISRNITGMGRSHQAHANGDAINAVLAAAGYNFRRHIARLRFLLFGTLVMIGLLAQPKLA